METIYWLQRLGVLNEITCVLAALGLFATIAIAIARSINVTKWSEDEEVKTWNKRVITALVCTIISMGVYLFVPSEQDLYTIYGIGGTIDYIKSNDTAKQLPDKVINALDAWIDKQNEDNNKDK